MRKTSLICIVLVIFSLLLSVAALALGIVAVTDKNDTKIVGAYDIGLGELLDGEVLNMTYYGSVPDHRDVDFMDAEILESLRDVLRTATFQKTKERKYSGIYIHGFPISLSIETTNATYSIAIRYPIAISKNGESNCYNTNIDYVLYKIIYEDITHKLFGQQGTEN